MQVSDVKQQSNSATLGAERTRSVTMVEDASFFMMLSSNLYSNQLLACIREPLCNAWDAHIEAGTTDKPIEITMGIDGVLTIRDSGTGIPDDKIDVVYGTYGGSTKRNDSKTTGGFGLGSKSPWAYTESFRVTSEHAGVKCVYNMSRSSTEAEGKPGITKVVETTTDRSGLSVNFTIDKNDIDEVAKYIKYVVMHGGMNATFNGIEMRKLDMSHDAGSYHLDSNIWWDRYMGNHKIFIRYGSVVYPALRTKGTEGALEVIEKFMEMVGFDRILVQAAPDTLALTPSRETLSSQKMTEDGITDICVNLVDAIEKEIKEQIPKTMELALKLTRESPDYDGLRSHQRGYNFIRNHVLSRYLDSYLGKEFRAKYLQQILAANTIGFANANKMKDKAAMGELLNMYKIIRSGKKHHYSGQLFEQFVDKFHRRPFLKAFAKQPLLDQSRLRFAQRNYYDITLVEKGNTGHLGERNFRGVLALINRPVIFVTSRIKDVGKSIKNWPEFRDDPKIALGWVYKVNPSGKEKIADVVAALETTGFTVVNLTEIHEWDRHAIELQKDREKARAVKLEGIEVAEVVAKSTPANANYTLRNLTDKVKNYWTMANFYVPNKLVYVTEKPLFYIELYGKHQHWGGSLGQVWHLDFLTQDEWDNGIVVRNGIERNMAIRRGAVTADEYFKDRLFALATSKEYFKYMTKENQKAIANDHHQIESWHLRFCRDMKISLAGYDKLRFDPKFEKVQQILSCHPWNYALSSPFTAEQFAELFKVRGLELIALPFMKKLEAIESDFFIRQLGGLKRLYSLMNKYPERKPALKSLILSALKTGNNSDE